MKQYIVVNWEFNRTAWAAAVMQANEDMNGQLHLFMEVSDSAVYNWANGHLHESAPYPNMTNLIKFCNLTDTDPRSFFQLENK